VSQQLLTRDDFRRQVFARDKFTCVTCRREGQDAHHILERRLFRDGGYYCENGATLCGYCHFEAEKTVLSCDEIREKAGITRVVLPDHLYPDERYDKWGNVILANGRRIKGELFEDSSVQKILAEVLHLFDNRVKYPRTWHLPWSPSVTTDDRVLDLGTVLGWYGRDVVVTEKMDGENTTLYRDYMHARSLDYSAHVTRNWMKNFHARIAHDIPESFRICGENLSFKHSIKYAKLPTFFLVFSIWQRNVCLSWDATLDWCELLGLQAVPVLYRGVYSAKTMFHTNDATQEGYVIRPSAEFTLNEFSTHVGKYVRKSHVQTHGHWMRSHFEPNELAHDGR
jgi:hypothetical protein